MTLQNVNDRVKLLQVEACRFVRIRLVLRFDPASAEAAGVLLERVLSIRCGHNVEHALKAVDLLIQGGGFGLVAMDLGDTPPATARQLAYYGFSNYDPED